jgi:hypothetical protein
MGKTFKREEVLQIFRSYIDLEYSPYMAVRATANSTGMTMSEVGKTIHPKGIKHKPKEAINGKD